MPRLYMDWHYLVKELQVIPYSETRSFLMTSPAQDAPSFKGLPDPLAAALAVSHHPLTYPPLQPKRTLEPGPCPDNSRQSILDDLGAWFLFLACMSIGSLSSYV